MDHEWRIFQKNDHTIYYGDALNVMSCAIADASIDLIFADPPYNVGKMFGQFHDRWASDLEYAR